ncbi:hypothetical protein RhiirA5_434691 [Rhizophagus irregularis]|uniref:Uncharacterized protein n=1 Tax=Rhizophagus irregularis TaxID=588596 RepID=A0A2N0NPM3_9GLOM|nr:hypothetical protein RhiirA5_434691 [Rhizophagus irregularis]PKC57428.1 hypothetical protein RhiirA1_472510 [Rhizophagus irregularis]
MDGDLEQKVFIPFIPGYCIYTKLGETFFKFNLEWSTEQNKILYRWTDYASDSNIKYTGTISITFLLGFTCKSNVKRKSQEIQQDLYFDDLNNGRIIKDGLPISANGWQRSQIIQAMDTIHKLNNQLKSDSESSEDKLEEDNVTSDTNESDTNSIIQNLIQKSKLGSTILISTDVFLQLISNQPCIICYDTNSSNQKFKIKTNGLGVQVDCITGAGLIGGVNREELCSILAFLGITKQNGHQQYYNKQEEYFENLYQAADLSANNTLREVCDYLQNKGQDLLEVSFDCTWSHVQASGEFIFNGELEEYEHRPILAFHVVEKKREY